MRATNLTRLLALATLLLPAVVQALDQATSPATLTDIKLAFKLDPRLVGGTYAGERWIAPPAFNGSAGQNIVDTKAVGVGAKGELIPISPKWMPSDPEMVVVSPGQGDEFKVEIKRAGESKLQVAADGFSKDLLIKAEYLPKTDAIQVHITPLTATQAVAPVKAEQGTSAFQSQEEKLSYAIGMRLGNDLRKKSIAVDPAVISQGVKDAFAGDETLLTPEEAQVVLAVLNKELRWKQAQEKYNSVAEKNKQEGQSFLTENKSKEGVVTLPSGLQYKILTAGTGIKPTLNDKVRCNFRGTLLDGTEFDSSSKHRGPVTFALAKVISGWREALQLMPVGAKWQIFVPSELAYGERGTPLRPRRKKSGGPQRQLIGPNETLIFEVELLSLESPGTSSPQRAAQSVANEASSAPSQKLN